MSASGDVHGDPHGYVPVKEAEDACGCAAVIGFALGLVSASVFLLWLGVSP